MKTELTLWLLSDSDAPVLPPLSVRTPACYRHRPSVCVLCDGVCPVILVSRCNLLSWPRERVTRDFLDNSLYSQSTQWPGWSGRQHVSITNWEIISITSIQNLILIHYLLVVQFIWIWPVYSEPHMLPHRPRDLSLVFSVISLTSCQYDYVSECPEDDGFFADALQCDRYYECRDGEVRRSK